MFLWKWSSHAQTFRWRMRFAMRVRLPVWLGLATRLRLISLRMSSKSTCDPECGCTYSLLTASCPACPHCSFAIWLRLQVVFHSAPGARCFFEVDNAGGQLTNRSSSKKHQEIKHALQPQENMKRGTQVPGSLRSSTAQLPLSRSLPQQTQSGLLWHGGESSLRVSCCGTMQKRYRRNVTED